MTNIGPERLREYKRLALSLAVALALSVLASLLWVGTASADHIFCVLNPAASYTVMEGGSVTLSANSSGCTSIRWDLDNDGQYDDGSSSTITFAADSRDGPGSQIVGIEGTRFIAIDPDEYDVNSTQTTVNIVNVPPTATFNAPDSASAGGSFTVSFTNPSDPSSADTAVGFIYAFDCDGDGVFEQSDPDGAVSCTGGAPGIQTVRGKISDKDGGSMTYTHAVNVVDNTAPRVTGATPTGTGVKRNTNVLATFSEKMERTTITKSTFKLFKVNKEGTTTQVTNVTVTKNANGLRATLNPFGTSSTLLAKNTRYKAVVTTGAKDLAGNPLDQKRSTTGNQPKVWFFTTGSS